MDSCCGPPGYDRVFGRRLARRSARRYCRHGLTPDARRIVEIVAASGLEGAEVLEIGGGVGEIQVELLRRGAARATNLELVGTYEDDATAIAREAGVAGRVERRLGDIAVDPGVAPVADVVVLHRVVCCYPDVRALLGAAADHARRLVVFSHPPDTWLLRALVGTVNLTERLRGRDYRAFVHEADVMHTVLAEHGLRPVAEHRGLAWQLVSARPAARPRGLTGTRP